MGGVVMQLRRVSEMENEKFAKKTRWRVRYRVYARSLVTSGYACSFVYVTVKLLIPVRRVGFTQIVAGINVQISGFRLLV